TKKELNVRPDSTFTASPNTHTQTTADLTVTGTTDWFGQRQEMAVGADYTRVKVHVDYFSYFNSGALLPDPRTFNAPNDPDARLTGSPNFASAKRSTIEQYGMYASLRLYFDNLRSGGGWSIVGGTRLSGDSLERQLSQRFQTQTTTATTEFSTNAVVTP